MAANIVLYNFVVYLSQTNGSECHTTIVLMICDHFKMDSIWFEKVTFPLSCYLQLLSIFPVTRVFLLFTC